MADNARALLKQAVAVLKANPTLAGIVGERVVGAVPKKPVYPFVLITCNSVPFSSQSFAGMEHTLRVQAFARENKPGTALVMREAIYNSLNRNEVNLALPDNELVMIEFDGVAGCFPEPDGRTYQSFIEFKVLAI
ncbi:hypothetical protein ABIB06_006550 [Bradyrhizobium sp. LB8.2]|uniref:DUF3168 domain-containing protein n=1 Tax=unclassified Bradyrhizobium TaxID=2631580 RepID=UPI0033970D07